MAARQLKLKPIASAIRAAMVGLAFAAGNEFTQPAHAQSEPGVESSKRNYRVPAGSLGSALTSFASQAGVLIAFDPELVREKTTSGISGDYTVGEAMSALLAGSGLEAVKVATGYTLQAVSTVRREENAPGGETQLGTVTVTESAIDFSDLPPDEGFKAELQSSATKTPLPIRETPQAISVITQDSIEVRQAQDLGQALETAAGVNQFSGPGPFAGKSPFGFDEVTIRGINVNGYFDNREDGFISPTFFSQPDLAIYERIEAVKGPSSVLYGRGSAGGFINRVRKKPLPEYRAEIAPSVGSFDRYRLDADVTGPLSDRVRGRVVAAYEDAGAFVNGVESERLVFAPSFELDVTESTRLLLQATYQEDDFIPNSGFPLVRDGNIFRAPKIPRSLFVGVPNRDENEWEVATGAAQLEQKLGDKWLATLRFNRSSQDTPIDTDSYAYGIQPNGDVGLYSSAFEFDTDVWSGEIRLEGSIDLFNRPATLAFGLDHNDLEQPRNDFFVALGAANIYDENFADFPTVQPTILARDSVVDAKGTGVYAQLQFRPFERLSVLAGGRYDRADSAYINNLADMTSEREDEDFTARLGLNFDVTDRLSVYGLFAESFFPTQFNTGADGELLEPEVGEIYELGMKSEWLNGKLAVNAAIFRIERDKIPIPDPTNPPGEFDSISAGLQRSDGFELEINGEPLPGWSLSFGGIVLDSEFTERDDPFFGSIPAGAADWQVGLFTSYELQSGSLEGLGAGLGVFAIDDRGVSSFIPGATLEGYERVDLSLFYNGIKNTKIALQARNVFNERYVEGADRVGAYAQFGSPTAYLLTLRYDFNGVAK